MVGGDLISGQAATRDTVSRREKSRHFLTLVSAISSRLYPQNPIHIPLTSLSSLSLGCFASLREKFAGGLAFGRRPKTSLNGFLVLLSCGVAQRASLGEKSGMENRRKCSKIWRKWKQLTSIAVRTTAHCAGPEVRTTYLGIKGAHIGSEEVRSGQKRVDVSVAKKSFLPEDLRRQRAGRRELRAGRLSMSGFGKKSDRTIGNALRGVPGTGCPGSPLIRRFAAFASGRRLQTTQSPKR